ncbi:MAG TPA: magnesium transporter [Burkholderiales bacterium]|nr:magnesium transporter [Burkholderiales bacterium]
MSAESSSAVAALNQRYLLDYPHEAARQLEAMPAEDVAELLAAPAPHAAARAWQALAPDIAAAVLELVPESLARVVLSEAEPAMAVAVLAQLEPKTRARMLKLLEPQVARELRALLKYPEDSAGRIMDPQVSPVREDHTVAEALARLRALKRRGLREMFVVNAEGVLTGLVEIQDLAVSDDGQKVRELAHAPGPTVRETDPREEVVEVLQRSPISSLPVVNHAGRPVGVIRQAALVSAIEEEASADMLTMVGASRDERALSGPVTAVRKRLAWLQINLATAFLAASVVGMFESLIAKFTALAVLLPVVAGQSGNAGGQALAVTMRGLFLREITLRHLPRVLAKEAGTGLLNGVAVAATTAAGVWVWSRSPGLALILAIAMVVSMIIAGVAGALVPMLLERFGQDPATASTIILTTVTDCTGFFSFLGTATLLSALLPVGPVG